MRILNLYAGIGGNRKLWGDEHEITAVELKPEIAKIYGDFFPNDTVIVGDAHEYLLKHFSEFDFIWASPPCPSHSQARFVLGVGRGQNEPIYPDMTLYQEILFLDSYFEGKWIVENVVPFYTPLIPAHQLGRHLYWTNFYFPHIEHNEPDAITTGSISEWQEKHGFDLTPYKGIEKRLALRNCVTPPIGKYLLDWALKEELSLFTPPTVK